MMPRALARQMALLTFAASAVVQAVNSPEFSAALLTTLTHSLVMYGLGWLCGGLGQRLVEEAVVHELRQSFAPMTPSSDAAQAP